MEVLRALHRFKELRHGWGAVPLQNPTIKVQRVLADAWFARG
jgi:hypothetical protein